MLDGEIDPVERVRRTPRVALNEAVQLERLGIH